MTDNVVDIKTRKKLERVENPEGETEQQFMRRWSKAIKDGKFPSVFIIVMDENEISDWGFISSIDRHYDILPLVLEDIREQVKQDILGWEYEVEFEE